MTTTAPPSPSPASGPSPAVTGSAPATAGEPPPAPTATATATAPAPAGPGAAVTGPDAGSAGVPWVLLAAALTAAVAMALQRAKANNEARERARLLFAEAYQWYSAYKEFPYAVRRRRTGPPDTAGPDERERLSEAMREIQSRIDYFGAWTRLEDPGVGAAYARLVQRLREVAGASVRQAWLEPGAARDEDMNIPADRVDLSALKEAEDAYIAAVEAALGRRWWRRTEAGTAGAARPGDLAPTAEPTG